MPAIAHRLGFALLPCPAREAQCIAVPVVFHPERLCDDHAGIRYTSCRGRDLRDGNEPIRARSRTHDRESIGGALCCREAREIEGVSGSSRRVRRLDRAQIHQCVALVRGGIAALRVGVVPQQIQPWQRSEFTAIREGRAHVDTHLIEARGLAAARGFRVEQAHELIRMRRPARRGVEAIDVRRAYDGVCRHRKGHLARVLRRGVVGEGQRVVEVRHHVGRHRRIVRHDPSHEPGGIGVKRTIRQHSEVNRGARRHRCCQIKHHRSRAIQRRGRQDQRACRTTRIPIGVHGHEDIGGAVVEIKEASHDPHRARKGRLAIQPHFIAPHRRF